MKPLHLLTIREAAALIASRALSPVELTEHFLARIERLDHAFVAYLHVDAPGARRAADQAEQEIAQGQYRGLLHGIPFAVKDNYAAAGLPMTAGSQLMADHVPDADAECVARLKQAGAVLLGKLNTWEYGTGNAGISFDLPTPPARNPWSLAHFTGGSSSGSGAALAGGLATFTLGSDTGGSVRLPAAACGLFGFKPTLGRISRRGVLPNCYSFDTVGPLGRSTEDCAVLLDVLAGHDPADAMSTDAGPSVSLAGLHQSLQGLRVGLVGRDGMRWEPGVLAALQRAADALAQAGACIAPVTMPVPPDQYRRISAIINWSESYAIHEADFEQHQDRMGHALREKLIKGRSIPASVYIDAQRSRRALCDATDALFQQHDLLLLPTTASVAPRIDDLEAVKAFTVNAATHAFSLTGHPAIAIPAGLCDGLPVSVQLGARYFAEPLLLAASLVLEAALGPLVRPETGDGQLANCRDALPEATPRRPEQALEDEARAAVQVMPRPQHKAEEPADMFGLMAVRHTAGEPLAA